MESLNSHSKTKEFLWFCAGSVRYIVRQCPTDHEKIATIGLTVLFTCFLAFISGSYALWTVFENLPIALIFGLVWGLMIFTLDRFIVSSIRKRKSKSAELIIASPRILVAVLIAMIIAVPLELRLFEPEINLYLQQDLVRQKNKAIENAKEIYSAKKETLETELVQIKNEIAKMQQSSERFIKSNVASRLISQETHLLDDIRQIDKVISEKVNKITNLNIEIDKEDRFGNPDLGRAPGQGDHYWHKVEVKKTLETQLAAAISQQKVKNEALKNVKQKISQGRLDSRLIDLYERQEKLESTKSRLVEMEIEEIKSAGAELTPTTSFLNRLKALSNLRNEDPTVDWTVALIQLLIIAYELSPIFVKLLTHRGVYDARLEQEENRYIRAIEKSLVPDQNSITPTEPELHSTRELAYE